jgi:ATP-dependent Zn protease
MTEEQAEQMIQLLTEQNQKLEELTRSLTEQPEVIGHAIVQALMEAARG